MLRTLVRVSAVLVVLAAVHQVEASKVCNTVSGTCNNICVVSTACCIGCYDTLTGQNSCSSCVVAHCRCCCKSATQTSELTDMASFNATATSEMTPTSGKVCAPAPKTVDQALGVRVAIGAFVSKVEPNSPASEAGLALCDLIVSFPGGNLREQDDHPSFRAAMREAAMLSNARLDVWKFDASTEIYKLTNTQFHIPARFGAPEGLATLFQVMVTSVPEGSAASDVGIRAWDFINAVNGEDVANMRNVIELDQKISEAIVHDGKVKLTLGRWKPIPASPEQKMELTTRDVTFVPRAAGGAH
jgi:C-terminal processing protease CtpA/Prc